MTTGKTFLSLILLCLIVASARTHAAVIRDGKTGVDVLRATICISPSDYAVVKHTAGMLASDLSDVTGVRPPVAVTDKLQGEELIIIGTLGHSPFIDRLVKKGKLDVADIQGGWERYVVRTIEKPARNIRRAIVVAGSDRRGTAYGSLLLSEAAGVSPWVWWADVKPARRGLLSLAADTVSTPPAVKYRGIFINDEDWGLKPWATDNYERDLGDIGPKTYARVCELLLRLKANMLAPAMHECTGAFYSYKESKVVCDSLGIIITTSHCEPLLLNNAALSEWDSKRDGAWNYKTNSKRILKKWNDRLSEASQYENIYTLAMRGVHDKGLPKSIPQEERVGLISRVIKDQRLLLEKHKGVEAREIPQIFVPYNETLNIYESGLDLPDDVTLVWVNDNYGYIRRISNAAEQQRSGGAGVYYHISYLGPPHDYLWLQTTPPALMYEELKKAYDTGANRYWLLNVGDIKPGELGMQLFFDMAWQMDNFSYDRVRTYQADFLASIFDTAIFKSSAISDGKPISENSSNFQLLLDGYYRLAWSRKPEFMGWEYEWDKNGRDQLRDTEFSFSNFDEAQQRLTDYQSLSDMADSIGRTVPPHLQAAYFELVEYPVKGAFQMNRKHLMAQLNHEQYADGQYAEANWAAAEMENAYDSLNVLTAQYNNLLNGKWRGMMSLPPGKCARYHEKPLVTVTDGIEPRPVDLHPLHRPLTGITTVDLRRYDSRSHLINIVDGWGYDGTVVQLGDPVSGSKGLAVSYRLPKIDADSLTLRIWTVPIFPLNKGRQLRYGITVDGMRQQVDSPVFAETNSLYNYPLWKDQVTSNGSLSTLHFAVDRRLSAHTLTLTAIDPGVMIQRIVADWGGWRQSYLGPPPSE